jgi:pimeloyl-ACP methyl ester carboxylesterase
LTGSVRLPEAAAVERVEASGFTIAYRRAGSGPPLVLLHGGASDGGEWRAVAEALAADHDVVAWDAPGCGGSSDPPSHFSLPGYADVLAAFMTAVGLRKAHVAGLSFGGGLGIQLAARHPRRVRSLVLVSAYAGWAGSLSPEQVTARRRTVAEELRHPEPGVRPVPAMTMLDAFAQADLRGALPRIRVPALVVHGSEDVRAPRPVAEALRDGIPGARMAVIPGAGHVCNVEAPAAVAAAIRGFLRSVR